MASSIHIALLVFLALISVAADDSDLRLVLVLAKHGSTSPLFAVPTMSWDDWPERGPSILTGMGMRQHYLLGRELRRRYDEAKLLNQSLLIHQTLLRSINHDYAIESAQAFVRGFLGISTDMLSEAELKFAMPPSPVENYFIKNIGNHTLPYGLGTLPYHNYYPQAEDIFDPYSCPKAIEKGLNAMLKSQHVINITQMYNESFVEIVKLHYKVNEVLLHFPIYIPLLHSIYETHRQFRETWLNDTELYNVTDYYQRLFFYLYAADKEANAYRATPILQFASTFLRDSLHDNIAASERLENLKAGFVFMEEGLLTSLLAHLGVSILQPIPPASIVTFEVHGPPITNLTKPENYTVKMKYNDREYPIGSCSYPKCSFPDFLNFVENVSKQDVAKWCRITPPS